MKTMLLAALALLMSLPQAVQAEDRVTLGWGRLFVNDAIGDTRDRWRTGSYSVSRVRAPSWSGALPSRAGDLLEFRFRGETIAPASLVSPASDDRRYAGALSFGLHTHFDLRGFETSVGADLVFTGPQTGIGGFQSWIHGVLGLDEPQVLDDQIGNGVHPTLVAEIGRTFPVGRVRLRPFVEAQAGAESLVRVGGDVIIGTYGEAGLFSREGTTGQRYLTVDGNRTPGVSLVMGADHAQVFDSAFLPGGGAATLSDTRTRVRLGMNWQGKRASVFYGATWLSREFEEQPEGQVLGALNLNLKF